MPESRADDDFFIGWNPLPKRDARWARCTSALLLMGASALCAVLVVSQRAPGSGRWEDDRSVTLEGIAYCRPYATIRIALPDDPSRQRTVLLVEEGKHGARDRIQPFDGEFVRVRGTFLHRDDRWMLELVPGEEAIERLSTGGMNLEALEWPTGSKPGQVTLAGEIIDPKCFLGGMKPGEGKTHKACATLCIAGGIPPMFIERSTNGLTYYLLVDQAGEPANDLVLEFVGDSVTLTGSLVRMGDLNILKIQRLERRL